VHIPIVQLSTASESMSQRHQTMAVGGGRPVNWVSHGRRVRKIISCFSVRKEYSASSCGDVDAIQTIALKLLDTIMIQNFDLCRSGRTTNRGNDWHLTEGEKRGDSGEIREKDKVDRGADEPSGRSI
jgi:hypothetical protein